MIGKQILKEIQCKSWFSSEVGLDYLSEPCNSDAVRWGSTENPVWQHRLVPDWWGVAYILNEPISDFIREIMMVLRALMRLRDLGNSLIVVEHDEDTMRAADCVVGYRSGSRRTWWRTGGNWYGRDADEE